MWAEHAVSIIYMQLNDIERTDIESLDELSADLSGINNIEPDL